ncbi:hypothetical protein SNE40_017999 [Patella caerulea]|uniref:Uncharacterized protein n=1 Tax=Patella caerulea TaxID=87958 RepID=A0AAN8JI43_PATCE
MRFLVVLSLLVLTGAQLFPFWNSGNRDRHDGYQFEYHSRSHLLVVRDTGNCYLIHADKSLVDTFVDKATRDTVEDDIIQHIKNNQGTHAESHLGSLTHFHDILTSAECVRRKIYSLDYTFGTATSSKS